MSARPLAARPGAARLAALAAVLVLAAPAAAQPYDPGFGRVPCPRPCAHPAPRHYAPAPAIVSGYLPRNNNQPLYNEPPARPPRY